MNKDLETAAATSSDQPKHPTRCRASIEARLCSSLLICFGQIRFDNGRAGSQLTPDPFGASSRAADFVNTTTADLLALSSVSSHFVATQSAEALLMMAPPARFEMAGFDVSSRKNSRAH